MFSIAGALTSLPYILATAGVLVVVAIPANLIENRSVAADARAGYVLETKLAAAEAKAAEIDRQLIAANTALGDFRAAAARSDALHETQSAALEKRIADYEAARRGKGRSCVIDFDDLAELRRRAD